MKLRKRVAVVGQQLKEQKPEEIYRDTAAAFSVDQSRDTNRFRFHKIGIPHDWE